ncbi:MAG: hypothetical protein LBS69_08405 [Prevotellaceae bacterium]|nr:hypothetical protein [Prevotellaceae bacterium]
MIKDKNERTRIGVGAIARNYNHPEREDALAIVGNGFYEYTKKWIAQTRQKTEETRQRIWQQLIGFEQRIQKLIPGGVDNAKTHFLVDVKGFVEAFKEENYECEEKTLNFLEEMGISTANLPRKKK